MRKKKLPLQRSHYYSKFDSGSQGVTEEVSWLVPYGNMMTILMVFFLILYSFSYLSSDVNYERMVTKIQSDFLQLSGKSDKNIESKLLEINLASDMEKFLNEKGLDRMTRVEINAQRMKILLTSPILFGLGKSEPTREAKSVLGEISVLIKKLPNKVLVEGHTDNIPIHTAKYSSNWELSVDRAISVVNYLVRGEKIPSERFAVAGYGEHQPLYPNDTKEHRSANRRIEIIVLRK